MAKTLTLVQASKLAHIACISDGSPPPALRHDLRSYPMRVEDGCPVFDASRMRQDQIIDVLRILGDMLGTRNRLDSFEKVSAYMRVFGSSGVREQDVIAHTLCSRSSVRRSIARLMDEGLVVYTEEQTRGNKATPRIRYWWRAGKSREYDRDFQASRPAGAGLSPPRWKDPGRSRVLHGSSVTALGCRCPACKTALWKYERGEAETTARKAGGTGLLGGWAAFEERSR